MPFKEACIQYLDELDASAKGIMSVNTIVNTDGYLKAYNTDYTAVFQLLKSSEIPHAFDFVAQRQRRHGESCRLRASGCRVHQWLDPCAKSGGGNRACTSIMAFGGRIN